MKYLRVILITILISAFGIGLIHADWETRVVNDDYDDLIITTTGGVFQTSPWVSIKEASLDIFSYFAFRMVDLPNNSVIDSAYLEFTAPFPWNYNQSCPVTIYGLKEGDLDSWNPAPDLNGFPVTVSFTNWDAYDLISGNTINVTVTAIIQELYDQFLWYDGNDMGFQIQSIAVSGGQRYQVAHDSDPTKALKLYIEYSRGAEDNGTYYKGYLIQNVSAGNRMSFDWIDMVLGHSRLTTIEPEGVMTQNISFFSNNLSPDNLVSVGDDLYMVMSNQDDPWNTSLFVTSDRGATWTNKGEVSSGAGAVSYSKLNALAYDEAGTIHIAYAETWDTFYINYTVETETFSSGIMIHDGGYSNHEHRAFWDEAHDTIYFTKFSGDPGGSLKRATIMRRHNGVWEDHTETYDQASGGTRRADVTWANDLLYWIMIDYQGAVTSRRLYAFELSNYSDITSWIAIGDLGFPAYVGGWTAQTGTLDFDIGVWNGDLAVAMERMIVDTEYMSLYRWDSVGKTWDIWMYNLTGFFPASQPEFHEPKMFYNSTGELNMGIIVEQDAGYSLVYNDFDHFQTSESTPPEIIAKVIGGEIISLGGDMNPYSPEGGGFDVTPPENGTNPPCIEFATTLEEIMACIDDYLNDTDPYDPDPPASNYPEHESFGRFEMKFYLWVLGHFLIFAPMIASAYKSFPYQYYPLFVVVIMVGLGLLWSLSGM